jgi:hypothetical protein
MTPGMEGAPRRVRVAASASWRADHVIRVAIWALAVAMLPASLATVAAAPNRGHFGICPFVLVLALLPLMVTGAGEEWRRIQRPQLTLVSH